jgi:hypothetical protein
MGMSNGGNMFDARRPLRRLFYLLLLVPLAMSQAQEIGRAHV